MRTTVAAALVYLALPVPSDAQAAGTDMQAEIDRGQQAGRACMLKHPSDLPAGQSCIEHEINKNDLDKALTPGFALGAYVEGIVGAQLKIGITGGEQASAPAAQSESGRTHHFASEIERLRAATGLSTEDLCRLTQKSCPTLTNAIKTSLGGF